MKQKKLKKWVAAFFVAMIAAVALSVAVFAEGPNGATEPVTVRGTDGTETGYLTLAAAAAAAKDGDTILLNTEITMGYYVTGERQDPKMLIEGKSVTLDGQGHTVTANTAEAFSMIEVRPGGKLKIQNIILDGSASSARRYSNIINIEGGEVTIEDGTVLQNNCTAAIGIGTNVPGGTCTMNGGKIVSNVMSSGSNDTGVAVTVLEESTFIMNDGIISGNRTTSYGSAGVMVNRGGSAILNGGYIQDNITTVDGMASAVHIKGGYVQLNGTVIQNNTSADGYGAVYVTNHSSFGTKWNGVLDVNGGVIAGNKNVDGTANAIYLWSRSSIADTGAYLYFSGSPKIEGASVIFANSSSSVAFAPVVVDAAFTPVVPVEFDLQFYYIVGQTIVEYADGVAADNTHFIAAREDYGFQKDAENNLLYTEQKRKVIFMDGENELTDLSHWSFVEDTITAPDEELLLKEGYLFDGWYTDSELTDEWVFASDILARDTGDFVLYAKWTPAATPPDETDETDEEDDFTPEEETPGDRPGDDTQNPQTGENDRIALSIALLFSGVSGLIGAAALSAKRKAQ